MSWFRIKVKRFKNEWKMFYATQLYYDWRKSAIQPMRKSQSSLSVLDSTGMVLSFSFCKFDMKGAFRSCRPIRKKIIAKLKQGANCASQSVAKPRLTFKRIVMCLVWMEDNHALWAAGAWQNDWRRSLTNGVTTSHWRKPIEVSEQNRRRLRPWQCQTTFII